MKKFYLLAFALGAFAFSANAQLINDDMESYAPGPVHEDHWNSWSGAGPGAENIVAQSIDAHSGVQSGYIGAGPGPQDALLQLDNKTSGIYTVSWWMKIPGTGGDSRGGYYNFQEDETAGGGTGVWAINVFFNRDNLFPGTGTGEVVDDANPANIVSTFTYPEDAWFKITHVIDLDADTVIMTLDGTEIYNGAFFSGGNLGAVDFYAIDANNEYFVDDVYFIEGTAGVNDFAEDSFKVYPNPVQDILNISTKAVVDNVTVYDVLGKVVLNAQPDAISPKINMGNLASGAYLVKVTIGNASKTIKVLK